MTAKGTDEGGEALAAAKGKDPLFEEEVDSPRVQNLADVVLGFHHQWRRKKKEKVLEVADLWVMRN